MAFSGFTEMFARFAKVLCFNVPSPFFSLSQFFYVSLQLMQETRDIQERLLLEELAQGNQEAFQKIFERYYAKILCFISGIIKSDDEAEDLCQEVFVKIWINRANFVDVRNLGVYLYVLSRNLTYNYLESKLTSQIRMEEQPFNEEDSHSPLDDLVAKDMQLLIDMVVESMPSQRKIIYKLSREEGLSNAEIAEKLQISKKTVENHLTLALRELRNALLTCLFLYFC